MMPRKSGKRHTKSQRGNTKQNSTLDCYFTHTPITSTQNATVNNESQSTVNTHLLKTNSVSHEILPSAHSTNSVPCGVIHQSSKLRLHQSSICGYLQPHPGVLLAKEAAADQATDTVISEKGG